MADKRSGISEFYSGLGSVVIFGTLYAVTNVGFFIFIGVLAGVLPMLRGVSKIAQARAARKDRQHLLEKSHESNERAVLRLAKAEGGRLTPAIVAVNSEVTLDEADAELSALVDKGYAELEVTDDGRLIYVFPEFLPRELP